MVCADSYLVISPTCLLAPGCPAPAHTALSLPSHYHSLTLPTKNTNTRTPLIRPLTQCRSLGQCSVLSPSCPTQPGCPVYTYTAQGSCEARCGHNPVTHPGQPCYCDSLCFNYGDCCHDYNQRCYSLTTTKATTSTLQSTLIVRTGIQ